MAPSRPAQAARAARAARAAKRAARPAPATDPLREQLLDAASRVFAREGYEGTKIMDIVREARLSTGAVYGRFRSKNDLLREAIIRSTAAFHWRTG